MADQFYGRGSGYGVPGPYPSHPGSGNPYLSTSSLAGSALERYSSNVYLNPSSGLRPPQPEGGGFGSYYGGVASTPSPYPQFGAPVDPSLVPGMRRPPEALYHHPILGNHNNFGQSEALFSADSLAKRPRIDVASNLPSYPQLPGDGGNCKFDHPLWVPEGGIPDRKEVPLVNPPESLPERPGEPDCPVTLVTPSKSLPERSGVRDCPYYVRTGTCGYGERCKYHHPIDRSAPVVKMAVQQEVQPILTAPPRREGSIFCPRYMETGFCAFGANCRYDHPPPVEFLRGTVTGSLSGLGAPAEGETAIKAKKKDTINNSAKAKKKDATKAKKKDANTAKSKG